MENPDVVVIGGGAAGLMCALTAGQRGRRVLVLDSSNKVGKKILMSGGGRCNFTNLFADANNLICSNPHFCKSALSRYDQWQFIALVEAHGIAYHERKHGELFCDTSAKEILAMLIDECQEAKVEILTHCTINSIVTKSVHDQRFELSTSHGVYQTGSVVIATGGLSIPKMGASGFGYDIAKQFGLTVKPTRAGLVPLVFSDKLKEVCERLSGVSIDCRLSRYDEDVTSGKPLASFDEALLFSHRGLTGPAALQISNYWHEREAITLNVLPDLDISSWLKEAKRSRPKLLMRNLLAERLPKSLTAELELIFWATDKNKVLSDWTDASLEELGNLLSHWHLKPSGTQGYRTAEVTLGGVDTTEISSKTMESKRQPGLFFVGEVLDVTGHLGGFNFQWAWSSGYTAGNYV